MCRVGWKTLHDLYNFCTNIHLGALHWSPVSWLILPIPPPRGAIFRKSLALRVGFPLLALSSQSLSTPGTCSLDSCHVCFLQSQGYASEYCGRICMAGESSEPLGCDQAWRYCNFLLSIILEGRLALKGTQGQVSIFSLFY